LNLTPKVYRLLVFDLDGTLVDTAPDIWRCANEVLREMGHKERTLEEIKGAIGRGVHELLLHLSKSKLFHDQELEKAVNLFREKYSKSLTRDSRPYPDVGRVLSGPLQKVRKAVVTNKPHDMSLRILQDFKLDTLFFKVVGVGKEFPPKPDPAGLLAVIKEAGVQPQETLLIGDSSVDKITSEKAGVDFAWVDHGYEDLSKVNPERIFRSATEWEQIRIA
jgi:phosphoglycolate phosphatase